MKTILVGLQKALMNERLSLQENWQNSHQVLIAGIWNIIPKFSVHWFKKLPTEYKYHLDYMAHMSLK